jgi:hypothetical protein
VAVAEVDGGSVWGEYVDIATGGHVLVVVYRVECRLVGGVGRRFDIENVLDLKK